VVHFCTSVCFPFTVSMSFGALLSDLFLEVVLEGHPAKGPHPPALNNVDARWDCERIVKK